MISRRSGSLWSTTYEWGIVNGDPQAAGRIFSDEVEQCTLACDRFSEGSELRQLSFREGAHRVSEALADYLACADLGWQWSQGLLDPLVGDALIAMGYDRDLDRLPAPTAARDHAVLQWGRDVAFDASEMLLTVATPCVVDLGATAKARVVDRIANRIVDLDVADGALVSIGGDIATSGTPPESGWPITVSESARSLKRERVFAEISIVGGAVATSSTVVRTWGEGGDLHHLIDPSTGRSASSPWRQVTVLAPTCLAANVAATAAHLQGEDALEILAEAGLGALVISRDFEVFEIGSWPRSST